MPNLSLKWKCLLGAIIPILILSTLLIVNSYRSQTQSLSAELAEFRKTLIQERQSNIQDAVLVAEKMLSNSVKSLSTDKKEVAQSVLQGVFFSQDNGYFFLFDGKGDFVSHPLKPEAIGTSGLGLIDPNGIQITVELQRAAQSGGGFISYVFDKPGSTEPAPKIAYAYPVSGTDWFIGSGLYIDDIDHAVANYESEATSRLYSQMRTMLFTSVTAVTIISLAIMFFVGRLMRPVRSMLNTMETIADGEGDLTQRVSLSSTDELGQLANAFNRFMDKLHAIVTKVTYAAAEVKESSEQIKHSAESTNHQLQKHDIEAEHIVTAMNQMSSTANEVAQNINQVSSATESANHDSVQARAIVAQCVDRVSTLDSHLVSSNQKVSSLKEQTSKIDEVLEVIGDIAEQTNLLALNAAIESARAGEQGRGFAVVADEVRKLASRTQDSTLSIKEMLDKLHELVAEVVASMESSRRNCDDVVSSTREIDDALSKSATTIESINHMTDQIATASTEQSSVTEELNETMFNLRDIVAQLLATSESAQVTANELNTSGQSLDAQVGQFKLS